MKPNPAKAFWLASLGTALAGLVIILANNGGGGQYPAHKGMLVLGGPLLGIPVLAGICRLAGMLFRGIDEARDARQRWLASLTPRERAAALRAEQAALWTGTAAAAVGLHEHHKKVEDRNSQTAVYGFPSLLGQIRAEQQQASVQVRSRHSRWL